MRHKKRGSVEKIFASFKPDLVNHHAAHIDVRVSAEIPYLTLKST